MAPRTPIDWYVAVDESDSSLVAAKYVVSRLAAKGDSLQLIRALPPTTAPFTNPVGALAGGSSYAFSGSRDNSKDLAEGEKFLARILEKIEVSKDSGITTSLHLFEELRGPQGAMRAINHWLRNVVAKQENRNPVLVLGHHEVGKIRATVGRLVGAGSLSTAAARQARIPTLVVPDSTASRKTSGAIVVAVDGSDESEAALRWAITNVVLPGDELHVVRVASNKEAKGEVPSESPPKGLSRISAGLARISGGLSRTSVALREIDEQVATAKHGVPEGVPVSSTVLDPKDTRNGVALAISSYAETVEASLVVIGSRGQGSVKRALLGVIGVGSVSDAALKEYTGRLLVYKDTARLANAEEDEAATKA